MIDNVDLIKPLLQFEEEGDFITVLVLKRKKDFIEEYAKHQSVRTIKSYTFYAIKDLEERYEEIKMLCEVFKARGYINFNTRNDKNVALKMIAKLVSNIESGNNRSKYVYDSVIGEMPSKQKRWVIDVDKEELQHIEFIRKTINDIEPEGDKIITAIPTLNGVHLITKPFRLDTFKTLCGNNNFNVDVQKNNPTLLYIPDSLIEDK
ncbi:hypothetical protein VB264_23305 [Arcicella aquatica]|uniref:Uncharacterized protein n=1 Tax=Arcicella aquatica TaxID=217141 RepID=A0ABU5QUG5_9BACT|nr:hypothetical protein [Arcicella aquatica]MEA5260746.1 hypothetical protein [Arcicella aquatica]